MHVKNRRKGIGLKARLLTASLICLLVLMLVAYKFVYPTDYSSLISKYAAQYELDLSLVYSVIMTESRFDPNAQSHKNAKGLMQITNQTGEWAALELGITDFNENDLFVPETNIQMGCWYLAKLIKQYESLNVAIAAYNGGSGNVSRWLKNIDYSSDGVSLTDIPYNETKRYVKKIEICMKIYGLLLSITN